MNKETGADRAQYTQGPRRYRGPISPVHETQDARAWEARVTDRCLKLLVALDLIFFIFVAATCR